jgi:hypothetical protein
MTPREQNLIQRLHERVKNPDRASDEGLAKLCAPAKAPLIAAAEHALGFRLPDLLREAYAQVGNGGFGKAYGFVGLQGGARDEFGRTLVKVYKDMGKYRTDSPFWRWPEGLLPVCRLGCGMWSCLDCKKANVPVFIFEPTNLLSDPDDERENRLRWANAFWHESRSFTAWLESWLNGAPQVEPKSPSRAWLKERIGYIPRGW